MHCIASPLKPRRPSASVLIPCGFAGLPATIRNGGTIPEYVSITYFEAGLFSRIFHVLGIFPERCELENAVVPADNAGTVNHCMGTDPGSPADLYFGPDYTKWTDLDTLVYIGFCIDNCACVDQSPKSRAVHMISAVAATAPSTIALPE